MRAWAELMCQAGRPLILLVDDLTANFDAQGVAAAIGLLGGLGTRVWLSLVEERREKLTAGKCG